MIICLSTFRDSDVPFHRRSEKYTLGTCEGKSSSNRRRFAATTQFCTLKGIIWRHQTRTRRSSRTCHSCRAKNPTMDCELCPKACCPFASPFLFRSARRLLCLSSCCAFHLAHKSHRMHPAVGYPACSERHWPDCRQIVHSLPSLPDASLRLA
jgi:hypothetical protein